MKKEIKEIIQNQIEFYIGLNGETGGWGESMRDEIGVDIIAENMERGNDIETTEEIRDEIRRHLIVK